MSTKCLSLAHHLLYSTVLVFANYYYLCVLSVTMLTLVVVAVS